MTIAETLKYIEARLLEAGIDQASAEAKLMLEVLLNCSRTDLLLNLHHGVAAKQKKHLDNWLERRLKREPLQHILGNAYFYGLELSVNPDVLIPRPETESLVDLALGIIKNMSQPKMLDIGTGSGAIALALKYERSDAEIMATDVSKKALNLAHKNAERYELSVDFVESDLLEASRVQAFAKTADVLLANLPYLPELDKEQVPSELHFDPALALYAGTDGLELFRSLLPEAFRFLKTGAVCLLELDPRNIQQAAELSEAWKKHEIYPDLLGRERFLKLER